MQIKIYDFKKGRSVLAGTLSGNVFTKRVNPAKHKMRVMDGYGIEEDVFAKHAFDIVRIEEQGGNIYESPRSIWDIQYAKDYGHGKQKFLSVKDMQKV